MSKATMPEPLKANLEYADHVKTGGERDRKFETANHPAAKKSDLTVLKQLKEYGARGGTIG